MCWFVSSQGIRKNFILIMELLGEVIDYGYIQGTSSELLKAYVFSDPVMVEAPAKGLANLRLPDNKTISSMAAQNSIITGGSRTNDGKNEIFVDIIEELNVSRIYLHKSRHSP